MVLLVYWYFIYHYVIPLVSSPYTCGQSYKCSTMVIYDSSLESKLTRTLPGIDITKLFWSKSKFPQN